MSRGAALAEVVGASTAVGVVTAAQLVLGWAHRTRRMTVLVRLSEQIGAPTWRPGWVALPVAVLLPLDGLPGPAAVTFHLALARAGGGRLLAWSGFCALLGFPLDDVWHRLFGQDVTLWGPTHLMLLTGAGLSIIPGPCWSCWSAPRRW